MSHQRIWDYYQSASLGSFTSAVPRLHHLIRLAARTFPTGSPRVLNVGIGDGTLERLALARGWSVHALDPSPEPVERCVAMGVEAHVGRIETLPYPADWFDAVFCSEVFEHLTVEELVDALVEVSRVLRPGGRLIGSVPHNERLDEQRVICPHCGEVFHRWGHHQSFTPASITPRLSAVFDVERATVERFVDWSALNWKGRSVGLMQKALTAVGIHGDNANVVFVARKWAARNDH